MKLNEFSYWWFQSGLCSEVDQVWWWELADESERQRHDVTTTLETGQQDDASYGDLDIGRLQANLFHGGRKQVLVERKFSTSKKIGTYVGALTGVPRATVYKTLTLYPLIRGHFGVMQIAG